MSRSAEVPLDEVERTIAGLVEKGLIRRQRGIAEIVAYGPEAVLEERVAEADLEAARRRRQAAAVRRQIGPLLSEYVRHEAEQNDMQRARNAEQSHVFLREFYGLAQHTLRIVHPPGSPDDQFRALVLPHERRALERRVHTRMIFSADGRRADGRWEHVRQAVAAGAEVRLLDRAPTFLMLADERLAAVSDGGSVLVLRDAGVTAALSSLFNFCWNGALPLSDEAPAGPVAATEPPSGAEREILAMLSLGLKDEALARQLGVSVRTVRRLVSQLLQRLQSTSRFQAGVRAHALGWVGEEADA
ncbi:LuxR C-terminal-related transcriptional regulator [Actinoplanes sp. NPDC023936]|uniref:helix-turn-helix transcriptional regulator n=1 Tax=Actinoplanes sp. NPDC023936 TaxID=3154910 RepID=UPI0034024E8A